MQHEFDTGLEYIQYPNVPTVPIFERLRAKPFTIGRCLGAFGLPSVHILRMEKSAIAHIPQALLVFAIAVDYLSPESA